MTCTISIEENVRVEFDRFYNNCNLKGIDIAPELKELIGALEENVIQPYSQQLSLSYDEGYEDGYGDGHGEGYATGYEEGLSDGLKEASE